MTDKRRWITDGIVRDSRRTALAAVFALTIGVMVLAMPGTQPMWTYWAASSVAVLGALALIVAGEQVWDRMLDSARAAGVVAPY